MKKLLVFLLTLLCLASFTACDLTGPEPPKPAPEVKPEPGAKPTDSQLKLMAEAEIIYSEVINNPSCRSKLEFTMSETEMTVKLKSPITLANGVKVSSYEVTSVMSETTGAEGTSKMIWEMKMIWVSKVDNGKHFLTMSVKLTLGELMNPMFVPKANVILDGNSFEYGPNAGEQPEVKPEPVEPEVKPVPPTEVQFELMDEAAFIAEEVMNNPTYRDKLEIGAMSETEISVNLKEPITLATGEEVSSLEISGVGSETTGYDGRFEMTWVSKVDNAKHDIAISSKITSDELNDPYFTPIVNVILDGDSFGFHYPNPGVQPEVKPTPEVQGKLMDEALVILYEVMNDPAYQDKLEQAMSETEMSVNLKEPITLATGVEVSSLKITAVGSETTGVEQTVKMTWFSKVDNAKHDLTMSMKATPDELNDPNFEPKSNVILDGNSIEFNPNPEVKPEPVEPEAKPTAAALLDEVMQAGDELFGLSGTDLIEETYSEDANGEHETVTLKKPVELPNCGVRVETMDYNMTTMTEATGVEETIKITWISKLDNAKHTLDMVITVTYEDNINPNFETILKGTVDGVYCEYRRT